MYPNFWDGLIDAIPEGYGERMEGAALDVELMSIAGNVEDDLYSQLCLMEDRWIVRLSSDRGEGVFLFLFCFFVFLCFL